MKIKLVLVLSIITFSVRAQTSVGITGGYSTSWTQRRSILANPSTENVKGFQVSALAYCRINDALNIGIEPSLATRTSIDPQDFSGGPDPGLLLNYIELPVMLSVKLPVKSDKMEFYVKGGYGISTMVRAFGVIFGFEDFIPSRGRIPTGGWIKSSDHGFYTGMLAAYELGHARLVLNSNLYFGLSDVIRLSGTKSRSFHTSLGYMIRL
jgi:hypothetical protein